MLGIGWAEMLVIAVLALVVVGPKELPMLLRNLGRMMGTVRRMSNEFRQEIDKAIAAEEFKEAQKAISDPLRQTTEDIRKEFNAIGRDGKPQPSGKLKPSDPGAESVVGEIHAQAGITPPAPADPDRAGAALQAQVKARMDVTKAAEAGQATAKAPARKPAAKKPAAAKTAGTPAKAKKATSAAGKTTAAKPRKQAAKPASGNGKD
ncbi:Sec-independent protein translocase protein TatB [Pelagibacterium sediminicola]|uniref:Sec-independent protein translocase protein TatB n=1 Tax=Pelagibacterium sediminicola TaxID=2248761 RepID=UPI000E314C86|nr:Sec-independent protein translocase protein TatB [Pelagibacterium sediminicola]